MNINKKINNTNLIKQIFSFILMILCLMCLNIRNVKGEEHHIVGASDSTKTELDKGTWYGYNYSGLKVTILDKKGNDIVTKVFLNKKISSDERLKGAYFSDHIISSKYNQDFSQSRGWSVALRYNINYVFLHKDNIPVYGSSDNNLFLDDLNLWNGGKDLNVYLEENGFSKIRELVDKSKTYIDFKDTAEYIIIEPMILFPVDEKNNINYFGTLFEHANKFLTPTGLNDVKNSEMLESTSFMFRLIANKLRVKDSMLGFTAPPEADKTTPLSDYLDKNKGYGVGIYKYVKVMNPPNGKIIIEKTDEKGDPLGGATFGLYTDSGCNTLYKTGRTDGLYGKAEFNNLDIRTYYYKEMAAPSGYNIGDNGKCRSVTATERGTKITVTNNKQKPKLRIKKVNNNGIPIGSISATFNIYKSSNCTGTVLDTLTTKKLSAMSDESIELDEGIYYIKETDIEPKNSGYNISDQCKKIDLNGKSGTVLVEFENPETCSSELSSLTSQKLSIDNQDYRERLFELYNKYRKKGLLNFANPSCGGATCNHNVSFTCLNAEYETQTSFDENNISCYNSEFDYNGSKVYCLDTFELTNPLGAPKTWNVKSGQMIINKLDRIAATGTVVRKCYFVDGNSSGYKPGSYFDYVSNLTFNENLQFKDNSLVITKNSSNYYLEYSAATNYLLNPVYAKIGDGNVSNTPSNNYNFIGYGVISKLNATKSYNIPFSITLGSKFSSKNKNFSSSDCKVNPIPELINPELRLEFRIIDTSNPFPGKSGSVRKVGTNWRYTNSTLFQNWYDNEFKNSSFYNKYKIQSSSDYGYNPYIAYIMETTNNSYNKDTKKPLYTIKLTPTDIRKIRKYNEKHKYDDFTLTCDSNGGNCKLSDDFTKVVTIKEYNI